MEMMAAYQVPYKKANIEVICVVIRHAYLTRIPRFSEDCSWHSMNSQP